MEREVVYLGQINDGREAAFPGTDVPRISAYAHAVAGCELDRRLADQIPGWESFQGPVGEDSAGIGIALRPGMFAVEGVEWVQMMTPFPTRQVTERQALCVRCDFQGSPLSLISAHRPTATVRDTRTEFDTRLTGLVDQERLAGRLPVVGLDANEAPPAGLAARLGMVWRAPYEASIVGFLLPNRIGALTVFGLRKTGEHPPVVAMLRVPLLNASA